MDITKSKEKKEAEEEKSKEILSIENLRDGLIINLASSSQSMQKLISSALQIKHNFFDIKKGVAPSYIN